MRPRCIPMFGPCYRQLCMCCTDSARIFRQCIAHINFDPNVRLRIVLVADLQGFKDGTSRRCWRGVSQKGSTHTIELKTILLLQYLALVCTNAFRLLQPVSNTVFRFCESIGSEIFYDHYAYYSHYNMRANAHNAW